jgi:hypothetical protein
MQMNQLLVLLELELKMLKVRKQLIAISTKKDATHVANLAASEHHLILLI